MQQTINGYMTRLAASTVLRDDKEDINRSISALNARLKHHFTGIALTLKESETLSASV